jgi:GTP cyclohydrolase FolE2
MARTYGLSGKTTKKDLVPAIWAEMNKAGWSKFKGNARAAGGGVLDLVGDIIASLDRRGTEWEGANLVICENQLDRRMFAVQAMIHMYFACRGFRTKGVSAIHKLDNVTMAGDATGTYRGRKKTGIVHCESLCPPANISFFKSHKKKDDLADSFLQGLYFLEHPV